MSETDPSHPHRCRAGHRWQHAGPSAAVCQIPAYDPESGGLLLVEAADCPLCSGPDAVLIRGPHQHHCVICDGDWIHEGRCLDDEFAWCPWCLPLSDAVPAPGMRLGRHVHYCPNCGQNSEHAEPCAAPLRAELADCAGCLERPSRLNSGRSARRLRRRADDLEFPAPATSLIRLILPEEGARASESRERWFRGAVVLAVTLTLAFGAVLLSKRRPDGPLFAARPVADPAGSPIRPSEAEPSEVAALQPPDWARERSDAAPGLEAAEPDTSAAAAGSEGHPPADVPSNTEPRAPAPSALPETRAGDNLASSTLRPESPARRADELPGTIRLPGPVPDPWQAAPWPPGPLAPSPAAPTRIESPPPAPPAPPPAPPTPGSVAEFRAASPTLPPPRIAEIPTADRAARPVEPPPLVPPPREAPLPREAGAPPGSTLAPTATDGPVAVSPAPPRPPGPAPAASALTMPDTPTMPTTRGAPPRDSASGAALAAALLPPAGPPGPSARPRPGGPPGASALETRAKAAGDGPVRPAAVSPSAIDAAHRALVSVRAGDGGERTGVGFVVDPAGYVVTTHGLVHGTNTVEVGLPDGRRLPVRLIARDPLSDIAVLKVDVSGLPALMLGESGMLRVGEPVLTVARSGEGATAAAVGRIVATTRATGGDFVTDLGVPPDWAGGPVLNSRGEAVGVASGAAGRGALAVPINRVKPLLRDLKTLAPPTSPPVGVPAR